MTDPMSEYVQLGWSGQLPMLIGIAALLGLGKGGVPGEFFYLGMDFVWKSFLLL